MGRLGLGRAQATRRFDVKDQNGEHMTGKHIYTGLTKDLIRGSWE